MCRMGTTALEKPNSSSPFPPSGLSTMFIVCVHGVTWRAAGNRITDKRLVEGLGCERDTGIPASGVAASIGKEVENVALRPPRHWAKYAPICQPCLCKYVIRGKQGKRIIKGGLRTTVRKSESHMITSVLPLLPS